MPTFGSWEHTVLTEAYEHVDYVSAHVYYYEEDGDLDSFLASAVNMDNFIDDVVATADAVRAARKLSKRIHISFDEWNVWYQKATPSQPPTDSWPVAPPLLEDHYNVADAVVVGNLLISLLRHSDRVHAASLAQLVNVIAPIMTEPGGRIWKQTTFHPFALTSRHAAGEVLRVKLDSPSQQTAKHGEASVVDAVATHDAESGEVSVFAVNRHTSEPTTVEIDVRAFGQVEVVEALTMANDDPYARSSVDDDTSLAPRANDSAAVDGGTVRVELPPVSWTVVRLSAAQG
jgi:alpha-N-arabinofuranosidase